MKKLSKKLLIRRGSSIPLLLILVLSVFINLPQLAQAANEQVVTSTPPETINLKQLKDMLNINDDGDKSLNYAQTNFISNDIDLRNFLSNYLSEYSQTFQPWKTKAAVRAIAVSDDYEYLVVGGGYLYDNEIHIYRWNPALSQYVKVWNSGDSIIKSDVTDVAIGETDHNDFLEIVATSTDGHFYVFEQKHIYDPQTNTENMFAHVYTSPYMGQVWAVELNDTDKDYDLDIIVASWDYKIHVFEYTTHSGYPFSPEHWINYEEKWVSETLGQHPTALVVGDVNYNGLPDFTVGTREGGVFIFENNGTVLDIHGEPYPLCQDNSYKLIYNDSTTIWRPIYSMAIGQLDNEKGDEVVIASFAFNAYVLRYNRYTNSFYLQKLLKDFEKWTLKDDYPADYIIDWGVESQNAYFNLQSAVLGTTVIDPLNYSTPWYLKGPYPYNSGASTTSYPCTINTTTGVYFHPNATHSAWETFDFGLDEEGTGNGNSKPDFTLVFNMTTSNTVNLDDIEISISPDYEHWLVIPEDAITQSVYSNSYRSLDIDVDGVLTANKWDYFRYVNLTVYNTTSKDYWLLGGMLYYVHQPVSTALSVTTGTLASQISTKDQQILIGTVDGRLLSFKYSEEKDEFVLTWDSWVDDRWTIETNIWDLVQVKTMGTMPVIIGSTDEDGNYLAVQTPSQSIPGNPIIYDFDIADITQDSFQYAEIVVTANDGNLYVFDFNWNYQSALTSDYFTDINDYPDYANLNLTVALVELDSSKTGPEIVIAGYDSSKADQVYNDYLEETTKITATDPPAFIDIWARESGTAYSLYSHLYSEEITGQLKELLRSAKVIPSVDGKDIDGDGDTDLVITIGELYYLENIGQPDNPSFMLDANYFEEINAVKGKRQYGNVQFVEFDHDGDYDVVLGYTNRIGATYFDNYGTVSYPRWTEKKELLNNFDEIATINLYNLTCPQFVSFMEYSPYYTYLISYQTGHDYAKEYMYYYMLNSHTNELYKFTISYSPQTSYIIAVNPVVARVEVNSYKYQTFSNGYYYRNFGFHVIESWSTRLELYNWTLTLDTADIDGDGKDEIIVGDFDNNVYFFEHMTNNTYKRTYRSPDLVQYFPTNSTPYASDQLGFEGSFNETIWNHVSYIVVNTDVDKDGLKEVIALAGNVIYVFEGTGIDDTYELIYRYDVLRSSSGNYLTENGFTNPSGLSWAKDLDGNSYPEIIVAFEKQVLVLEPYTGETYEIFGLVYSGAPSTGHYNLPGNSKLNLYENLTITGLRVTDINNNGKEEIIVYGYYETYQGGWYKNGFIGIIESNTLGYELIWQAPLELVEDNKILTVEIADQDYDGQKELLVGGEKGLAILEYNSTSTTTDFVLLDIITGHANYPLMHPQAFFGGPTNNRDLFFRSHDIYQLRYGNSSYIAVWAEDNSTSWSLYYQMSDDGQNWYSNKTIAIPDLAGDNAYFPTVYQAPSGVLYVAWVQQYIALGQVSIWAIFARNSTDYGQTWGDVFVLAVETSPEGGTCPIYSPSLFDTGVSNVLGFGYVMHNSTYNAIKMARYFGNNGTIIGINGSAGVADPLNGTTAFILNGADIVAKPDSNRIGIAFSGKKPVENRLDYDIWYMEVENEGYNVTLAPRKVLDTPAIERTPSLAYLLSGNHSAIITFDASGLKTAMSASYAVVSEDGIQWSNPDLLSVYPDYVKPVEHNGKLYPDLPGYPALVYYIYSVGYRGPKVVATNDGSFAVLTKFDMEVRWSNFAFWGTYYHDDLLFQIQTASSMDLNIIDKVTDIATGDTDGDGLKEILVADGNYARLLELFSTSAASHHYVISWNSEEYDNPVSDVAIEDTNQNGFPEILFTVQGDDLYVYEVTNLNRPIVDIQTVEYHYSVNEGFSGSYRGGVTIDINHDGINDFVVALNNATILGILGDTGQIAWATNVAVSPTFLAKGTIDGETVIFALSSNGDGYWLNYTTGISLSNITLEGTPAVTSRYTKLIDVNDDGTSDILAYDSLNDVLWSYYGNNGSRIGSALSSSSISNFEVGWSQTDIIVVCVFSNSTVKAFDLSWNVKWSYDAILAYDKIIYDVDINGDNITEFIVTSAAYSYLFAANGTLLWSIYTSHYLADPHLCDLNNDGNMDVIGTGGNHTGLTAVDSLTGEIIWSYYADDNAISYAIAIDNELETPIVYFAYYISAVSTGIVALDALTGTVVAIDDFGVYNNFPGYMAITRSNNKPALIFTTYQGPVKALSIVELDYTPVPIVEVNSMKLKELYEPDDGLIANTVVIDNFYAEQMLVYVNSYNQLVFYNYIGGTIAHTVNVTSDYGTVVKLISIDVKGDGYKTGVFFYTSKFAFGYYDLKDDNIVWLAYEYGKFNKVYDIIAAPLYTSGKVIEYFVIAYQNVNLGNYLRAYDSKGNLLWANDINIGLSPDQIVAGHLLSSATEDGYLVAAIQYGARLKLYYMKDGVLFRDKDGKYGYAEVSKQKVSYTYSNLIMRYSNFVIWYNPENDQHTILATLENENELLDIATRDINNDSVVDVFVSQNGTAIYAIDPSVPKITWSHKHSSFVADHLEICQLSSESYALLANDYHHVFRLDITDGNLLEGSRGIYSGLSYIKIMPSQTIPNSEIGILLMGGTFYVYNSEALLYYTMSSEEAEQNIKVHFINAIVLPFTLMSIMATLVIILITRKVKI